MPRGGTLPITPVRRTGSGGRVGAESTPSEARPYPRSLSQTQLPQDGHLGAPLATFSRQDGQVFSDIFIRAATPNTPRTTPRTTPESFATNIPCMPALKKLHRRLSRQTPAHRWREHLAVCPAYSCDPARAASAMRPGSPGMRRTGRPPSRRARVCQDDPPSTAFL